MSGVRLQALEEWVMGKCQNPTLEGGEGVGRGERGAPLGKVSLERRLRGCVSAFVVLKVLIAAVTQIHCRSVTFNKPQGACSRAGPEAWV